MSRQDGSPGKLLWHIEGMIAHSENEQAIVQSLEEHLLGVSTLAQKFGDDCDIEEKAKRAGLWHDLGKATPEFQRKLLHNSPERIDHKGFGSMWALELKLFEIAFAIAGHHGGMPDLNDLQSRCTSQTPDAWGGQVRYHKLQKELAALGDPSLHALTDPSYLASLKDGGAVDLRTRMLFSCLVDADYLDTESHFSGPQARTGSDFPAIAILADKFFSNHAEFSKGGESSELNQLRCRLFEEAVEAAAQAPGVYSLTIPTGGGKTRTALGFALRHAQIHSQRRVIVALPYTSILDQMAEEYGKIFGEDGFLLHYSGWQGSEAAWSTEEESARERRMRLAAENWEASLILTTTVQLFDSIFSNRPGACRKLHNLARSVIVLDEVQTLPMKYWEPICDVLGLLVTQYGATVVLSTATQPTLDRVPSFVKRVGKPPQEIIAEPAAAYQILKRVKYEIHIDEPWSWDKVTDTLLATETSGMVIVNTKGHALELFKLVQQKDTNSLHLSTLMCGEHRRKVIAEIKLRLKSVNTCRVISTQLVEAGVDIDFPLVMRAVGPLDRIVQAAGRCNREGKLGREGGRVIVFKPVDNATPKGSYQTGAGHFEVMYRGEKFVPDDPATFPAYFARLLQDVDEGVELNKLRERLLFETVAEKFHLIERGATRSVLTGYGGPDNKWEGSPAQALVKQLTSTTGQAKRRIYRHLQPYVVEIFQNRVNRLKGSLILEDSATGELYWWGEYDERVGIAKEQPNIDDIIL